MNSRACAEAVLPHRRVQHEQHLVRRALDLARGDAADLLAAPASGSRACAGGRRCRPGSGSRPRALPAAIASKTTAAGSAPSRARMMSTPARVAQISSCSTAAARNVSAAQTSGCCPCASIQVRELADGRGLARAVDADDQDHAWACRVRGGALVRAASKIARISSLTRSRSDSPRRGRCPSRPSRCARRPRRRRRRRSAALRAPRPSRRRPAPIAAPAHRPGATISSNRPTSCCVVRRRPSRTRLEQAHPTIRIIRHRPRLCCGRSIRSSSAARGVVRPASSRAICAAMGSSTPCRAPRASAASVVLTPFRHHLHARQNRGERPAARQFDADVPVAAERPGARQDQIAEPGQAGQRLAPAALGARQPRDLRRARA